MPNTDPSLAPQQTTADLVAEIEQAPVDQLRTAALLDDWDTLDADLRRLDSVLQRAADALRAKDQENSELREQRDHWRRESSDHQETAALLRRENAELQSQLHAGRVGSGEVEAETRTVEGGRERLLNAVYELRGLAARAPLTQLSPEHRAPWQAWYDSFKSVLERHTLTADEANTAALRVARDGEAGNEVVEGVVAIDSFRHITDQPGSTWVSLQAPLPIGTRVRVTALPKEAE